MLLAVAAALTCTNSLLGMYTRRSGPSRTRSRYQNPTTLPGLRGELMRPPSWIGRGQGLEGDTLMADGKVSTARARNPTGNSLWGFIIITYLSRTARWSANTRLLSCDTMLQASPRTLCSPPPTPSRRETECCSHGGRGG